MLPDRVSNPGPLTYESGALPIALRGPACSVDVYIYKVLVIIVMSNCLHCINARNLSIHAARMQLYIYLDMNLFYCERDYIIREPKK